MKHTCIYLIFITLLYGCGSDDRGELIDPTIKSMTAPKHNYQTFKQSQQTLHDGAAKFVYADLDTNDELDIDFGFGCTTCDDDGQAVNPIIPEITRVFDINDEYAMISMNNSVVEWKGALYRGNYPMILAKRSGELYPIIYENIPVEYDADLHISHPFIGSATSPNIAVNHLLFSRFIPTNDSVSYAKGFFKYELIDEGFVATQLLPDEVYVYSGEVLVDRNEQIYVGYQDNRGAEVQTGMYSYISKDGEESKLGSEYYYYHVRWHIQDGKFLALNNTLNGSEGFYSNMIWNGEGFDEISSMYNAGSYKILVASNLTSPRRSNFELNVSCIVNGLDENSAWQVVAMDSLAASGYRPYLADVSAAQNTLYCVDYQASYSGGETVTVFAFDTLTGESVEYITDISIHSPESFTSYGVVPISDSIVMFYSNQNGKVTEYYINPEQADYEVVENDGFITPVGFLTLF